MGNRLAGKNALVTGGSRGIGYAIAEEYARQGAGVVLLSRTPEDLERACGRIGGAVGEDRTGWVAADVSDLQQVERAVEQAVEELGSLQVLVNAAGVASLGEIDEMAPAEWEKIIRVNLLGTYHSCRAVWPHFKSRGGGSIVNVSSGSGRRAHGGWSAYCASKFGVMGLTDALQKEGRSHGIRCNVICPGPTATEQRRANFGPEDPSGLMRPEEVAKASVFFASDESRWVSGPGIDVRRGPI